MNAHLVSEIVDAGAALAKELLLEGTLSDTEVESVLKDLVHNGLELFEEHTGEPLFPGLIEAEDSV